MRTRHALTISLPPKMHAEFERLRKTEQRTASELVREALRVYMTRVRSMPVYTPTARELRELEKGRAAMRRGDYYTLDEFRTILLGGARPKAGAKKRRTRASA